MEYASGLSGTILRQQATEIIKENDRVIMLGLISDISSIEKLLKDNRKLHLLFGR